MVSAFGDGLTFFGERSTALVQQSFNAPLLGHGIGTLERVSTAAGLEPTASLEANPAGGFARLLVELGWLGILLFVLPLAYLLFRWLKAWRALPFIRLTADEESRLRKAGGRRQRHRKRKGMGKTPSAKILLGGCFLGMLLWLILSVTVDIGHSAFVLMMGSVVIALGLFHLEDGSMGFNGRRWLMYPIVIVPLLFSMLAFRLGSPLAVSQYHELLANQQLSELEGQSGLLFREPSRVRDIEQEYQMALKLVPERASAYTGLAQAQLLHIDTGLYRQSEVGEMVLESVDAAMAISEDDWRNYHSMGQALLLLNREAEQIQQVADRALELAPMRVEPMILKAEILIDEGESDSARQLLDRAREIEPENETVRRLSNRINLSR